MSSPVESLVNREYKYGFVTDIEADTVPKGLSEDVVRLISAKKGEPELLLEWRLKAYRGWLKMSEPHWPNVNYPPIDYQDSIYYSAPKTKAPLGSLDEVDPKLLETYAKLGIPLTEQKMLAGVAVDAIFDSVSVGTTYKTGARREGHHLLLLLARRCGSIPELVRKYLGSVVPASDNFFAALNSAVFSDGSFVYVPKGVRCPMELSTYFRINAANTGQFERTLIIADEGASVSYLEGCTAPKRDENQLHAAVVELVALEAPRSSTRRCRTGTPATRRARAGSSISSPSAARRSRGAKISWTQVETGSAITWKYPSVILQGDDSVGEFYSVAVVNNRQQADTGTKMIHIGRNTRSTIVSKGISGGAGQQQLPRPGEGAAEGRRRAELHPVRFDADRQPVRRAHLPLHRRAEPHRRRWSTRRPRRRSARTRSSTASSAGSTPRTPSR